MSTDNTEDLRSNITQNIKLVVKKLQLTAASAFSSSLKTSDTTSSLCYLLEAVFLLGLKSPFASKQSIDPATNTKVNAPTFWVFLTKFTHKDVCNQLASLKFITTETGLCRAWIRAALNDGLLTSYISTILDEDVKLKRKFYNKDAYWFDLEQTSLISGLLQGIEILKFDLPYNVSLLNSWGVTPLELSGYIKVATLPVLCKPDSLPKSGDIAAVNRTSSSRTFSQFESSYFDSRYSTEALGDLDITTPRRKTKKKRHSMSKRKSLVTEISSLASSESLNISENFKLETSEDVNGAYSEGSAQNLPISTGSSASDVRAQSVPFDENEEEIESKDDSGLDLKETATKIEIIALDNPIITPTDNGSIIKGVKTSSQSGKANSLTHIDTDLPPVRLFDELDNTKTEVVKTSTPNISLLESSPAESGNNVSNYHSALNTWTDTARSSPNLYPFLTLPDEVTSPHSKASKQNSSNTSKTDISCYSNDNDFSSTAPTVGVDASHSFTNDVTQISSAASSSSQDFEVIHQTLESSSLPANFAADFNKIYVTITRERGLPAQNYMCKSCTSPIGTIYGKFQVCAYDSCYYCSRCHSNDEAVIPALIVHNWDFTPQKVSCAAKTFLCEMENEPLIDFDQINNNLYEFIAPLREMYERRKRLKYAANYLFACSENASNEVRSRLWPKDYMLNNLHVYSVHDLLQLQTGYLAVHLQKVLDFCIKHIFNCIVCREKGFICEICRSNEIIYAFNVDQTVSCETCFTVFHKTCKSDYSPCPTCRRRSAYTLNRSLGDN